MLKLKDFLENFLTYIGTETHLTSIDTLIWFNYTQTVESKNMLDLRLIKFQHKEIEFKLKKFM